ncbi:hypothetical protein BH20ACT3_BH20ACT3_05530 [soil metagenome]
MAHRLRPMVSSAVSGRNTVRAMLCAVVLTAGLGACSDPPPDPEEARRARVETRLRDSFSANQATCILERLDEPTLVALDRTGDLDADSDPMTTYSQAVADCIIDPGGTADEN